MLYTTNNDLTTVKNLFTWVGSWQNSVVYHGQITPEEVINDHNVFWERCSTLTNMFYTSGITLKPFRYP